MDIVNEFIRNVVVCILIVNIVDCLTSSKEYGKYVKIFTGVIVIIAIIYSGEKIIERVFNMNVEKEMLSSLDSMDKDTIECAENIQDNIYNEYKEYIITELQDKYRICVKNVHVDNNDSDKQKIDKILVKIGGLEEFTQEEVENNIYEVLSKYYNVEKKDVKIRGA